MIYELEFGEKSRGSRGREALKSSFAHIEETVRMIRLMSTVQQIQAK